MASIFDFLSLADSFAIEPMPSLIGTNRRYRDLTGSRPKSRAAEAATES